MPIDDFRKASCAAKAEREFHGIILMFQARTTCMPYARYTSCARGKNSAGYREKLPQNSAPIPGYRRTSWLLSSTIGDDVHLIAVTRARLLTSKP